MDTVKPFERIPTGVPGLDPVVSGGLLKGGTYLLMGAPGSGKTVLANQIAFSFAERGGNALYVTMLAEAHGRLFGNLKAFGFFSERMVADRINYISAYEILEKDGLDGLIRTLAQTVRKYRAGLLFIDGVASIEGLSKTPVSFKKFVHDLNTVLFTSGCTAFLLSSMDGALANPEHTMVDGIFALSFFGDGLRTVREIEVRKFRGSPHFYGKHYCKISDEGMRVYPRVELLYGQRAQEPGAKPRLLKFGIKKLDEMMGGGMHSGTVTSLLGAAGTGKTWLGTQFLEQGAECGEPGLYFGFYETPERLLRKVTRMGSRLEEHVRQGLVELHWRSPTENVIDELVDHLFAAVRRQGSRRVFIDGMAALSKAMLDPRRMENAIAAIANELRRMEVGLVFTEETEMFPIEARTPISDQSAVTDNIVYLRQADFGGRLRRFLSVIKTRETPSSPAILEMALNDHGLVIDGPIDEVDGLFTGTPRLKSRAPSKTASKAKKKKKKKKKKGR